MPDDFGAYQRMNNAGVVHASKTMRAGALKLRVTTRSSSDFRCTVVRPSCFLISIGVFLAVQCRHKFVQRASDRCLRNSTLSLRRR